VVDALAHVILRSGEPISAISCAGAIMQVRSSHVNVAVVYAR
jgi:hypothetical protein